MSIAKALNDSEASSSTVANDSRVESLNWLADAFWNVPSSDLLHRFSADAFAEAGFDARDVEALNRIVESMDVSELHDAAIDHTTMFALGSPKAPLPYESVYSGSDRQLMKPERDVVYALYQEHGFVPLSDEAQEPEDHISHELRFLAYLLQAGNEDVFNAFLNDHINRWIPLFAQEVNEQSDTAFYKSVSKLMI